MIRSPRRSRFSPLPPVCRLAQLFAPSERCRRGGRDDENPGLTVGHRPPPPLFGHGEPEVGLRREWGPARDLPWAGKSIYCNRLGRGQPPGSPLRLQRVVSALPTLIICRAHIPSITGTAAQHSLSPLSLSVMHIYIYIYSCIKGAGVLSGTRTRQQSRRAGLLLQASCGCCTRRGGEQGHHHGYRREKKSEAQ